MLQDCRVGATRADGVAEDVQLAKDVWRVTEEQLRAASRRPGLTTGC